VDWPLQWYELSREEDRIPRSTTAENQPARLSEAGCRHRIRQNIHALGDRKLRCDQHRPSEVDAHDRSRRKTIDEPPVKNPTRICRLGEREHTGGEKNLRAAGDALLIDIDHSLRRAGLRRSSGRRGITIRGQSCREVDGELITDGHIGRKRGERRIRSHFHYVSRQIRGELGVGRPPAEGEPDIPAGRALIIRGIQAGIERKRKLNHVSGALNPFENLGGHERSAVDEKLRTIGSRDACPDRNRCAWLCADAPANQ
jgi:hypothetical protein